MFGWWLFRRVNRERVPFNAVIAVSVFSLVIAIPALFGKNNIPFAFLRSPASAPSGSSWPTSSRCTCGCGGATTSSRGRGTSAGRYKLVNTLAIVFVVLVVYSLDLPYTPAGLPWNDGFDASLVNHTPLAIVVPLLFGLWYLHSAKDRY